MSLNRNFKIVFVIFALINYPLYASITPSQFAVKVINVLNVAGGFTKSCFKVYKFHQEESMFSTAVFLSSMQIYLECLCVVH